MTTSPSRPSSVVLGAGLMGRLLAWQLARAGHAVTVYEAGGADAQGSPARIAAAMLAPLAESAVTEPSVVEMGRYALTRWPELLAQLSQPVFFQQDGTLIVWHRQDAADAQRFARLLQANQEKVPALPKMQALDATGMAEYEPALGNRFTQGLYLPGEGQLDNRQLLAALLHELQTLKVDLHWNSPRAPQDFAPGTAGQPDWVFDCRGLGAQAQWPQLRGIRGEVARIHAPEVTLRRPTRMVHPRYSIYIAPKQDHVFVIGATEIESNDLSPPSVRSTLELLSAAYAVHSGFAEARILEIASQCRPTLPDNLPAIRQLGPRSLQINGMYRHGFMISPALLDAVLELVHEQRTTLANSLDLHLETVPT
ncbi:FAD-dependent oxidoreductase [Curvibacter delicatus]|jgi:glycine oxidase|uniref:FAD-dependent oxidoreductase n=1 Tax=Curvibacter delicatus TaxID=80879 RepID=UPI000829E489|nr:FAD-dependent oxidoreductase [Curvibacter delicatus]